MNLIIIKKLFRPYKRVNDWIDSSKLKWSTLSLNPNAIDIFKGNEDKLVLERVVKLENAINFIESNLNLLDDKAWINLNKNPKAIDILKRHPEKINITKLCKNPNGVDIIRSYIQKNDILDVKIDFLQLHMNPNAIDLLNKYYDTNTNNCFVVEPYMELMLGNPKVLEINIMNDNLEFLLDMDINVSYLFRNKNPELKNIIITNIDKAIYQRDFRSLSASIFVEEIYIMNLNIFDINGNIIDKDNEYMIDWKEISRNKNAFKLIEKNLDKIDWMYLSGNPCAINIIRENMDKINWAFLSSNPNIFEESWERYIKNYTTIIDIIME